MGVTMDINMMEALKALFMLGLITIFIKGISSRDYKWLFVNYVLGFFEIMFLRTLVGYVSIFAMFAIQNFFLFKEDSYWKEGVITFIGDSDPYRTKGTAYKVQMRYGVRYLIVQLKCGKAYYYEDNEKFYDEWRIEPGNPQLEKIANMRV